MVVRVSSGKLKEESHYYPFGLPIGSMGSAAAGFMENKHKYQSNAYNKEQGLNWMDFHNRQYDPQLGRFLSIDPLAANTPTMSPYTAMDNDPGNQVDPMGLMPNYLSNSNTPFRNSSPYESVVMQNQRRSNAPGNIDYGKEEADFAARSWANHVAQSNSEKEKSAVSTSNTSATQGTSSSEVCNNNEESTAAASDIAGSSDGGLVIRRAQQLYKTKRLLYMN